MSGISDYVENETLDHWLKALTAPLPATVFLALYTVAPTDSGGGTEVSGFAYARLEIGAATGRDYTVAAAGSSQNNEDWTWPAASGGAWGDIVAIGIFDALTVGNLLFHGALGTTITINDADVFELKAGTMKVLLD